VQTIEGAGCNRCNIRNALSHFRNARVVHACSKNFFSSRSLKERKENKIAGSVQPSTRDRWLLNGKFFWAHVVRSLFCYT